MADSSTSNMGTFDFILLVFVGLIFIGAFIYVSTYLKAKAVDQVVHEHHERKVAESN